MSGRGWVEPWGILASVDLNGPRIDDAYYQLRYYVYLRGLMAIAEDRQRRGHGEALHSPSL